MVAFGLAPPGTPRVHQRSLLQYSSLISSLTRLVLRNRGRNVVVARAALSSLHDSAQGTRWIGKYEPTMELETACRLYLAEK
jgi:hypothetical protein